MNQIDSKTGTIELQATFPNPEKVLLPGQFGRVRMKTGDRTNVDSGSAAGRAGNAGIAVRPDCWVPTTKSLFSPS